MVNPRTSKVVDIHDPREYGPWARIGDAIERHVDVQDAYTDYKDNSPPDRHLVEFWIHTRSSDALDDVEAFAQRLIRRNGGRVAKSNQFGGRWLRLGRPDLVIMTEWPVRRHKHGSAALVASRYLQAKEHSSPEARREYLRQHPKADPSNHTVRKTEDSKEESDSGGLKGRVKRFLKTVSNVSAATVEALRKAPESIQRFVTDKAFRKEATTAAAKSIKENAPKVKKRVWDAFKSELDSFPKAGRVISKFMKGGKVSREDAKTLYGVGVYVAGVVLAMTHDSGTAALAFAGSKALAHSFAMHVGIKSLHGLADEGFLAYEAIESAATGAGIADKLPIATSDIPGVGWVFDAVGKLVVGSEKEADPSLKKFVDVMVDEIEKVLRDGISDKDMKAILQHGVAKGDR